MQHQFKAGDLALIVGGSSMIGECVTLIQWVDIGQVFTTTSGRLMRLMPGAKRAGWHVESSTQCVIKRPEYLMPLKGDQSPIQTNTETPKEVVHG